VAASRRLAAIMFADMVGFTATTQDNETGALALLREQEELVRPLLEAHRGRKIKSTGDGFLAEFESALHAVQCAVDILQRLHDRNSRRTLALIELRIGVHLGDVEKRGKDIFGDAVNVASRIEPLATPGGLCISGQVYDAIRNKIPNKFEKLEPQTLKNVRTPIEIYRATFPWEAPELPPVGPPSSLAVLPLANISPDPKDEYFADGLTEELISTLSQIRGLRVIARTSVGQYKSTSKTVSRIGAELGVASVLEGSVRKSGNRLRITLQLIAAGTQDHLWTKTFDRELDDVFAIQTEVAEQTALALRLELVGPERQSIQKKPTSNLAAYNLYLKGIHAVHRIENLRTDDLEGITESIRFFEAAIREDPSFSNAYSHLANVYIELAGESLPAREAFSRAKELIDKAFDLDPNSSDVHTALGNLALQHHHDWAGAEREFKVALSLNPNSLDAHSWYGVLLQVTRRFDEAIEQLRIALGLDPLSAAWTTYWLSWFYCLKRDYTSAIELAEDARDRNPQDIASRVRLGLCYAVAGRIEDAKKEAEHSAGPAGGQLLYDRATLWCDVGVPEIALRIVEEAEETAQTQYVNFERVARLCAALGQKEKALDMLERDFTSGDESLWISYNDPVWDRIRDDPRFTSLLSRHNLKPT
jgi:adenylate cyclase